VGAFVDTPTPTFCTEADFDMTNIVRDMNAPDVDRTSAARICVGD
jgi:hypothetical protein